MFGRINCISVIFHNACKKFETHIERKGLNLLSEYINVNETHHKHTKHKMASLSKVNIALSSLVVETAESTIDKVLEFLGNHIEVDEDMRSMFAEFKKQNTEEIMETTKAEIKAIKKVTKKADDAPKQKRAPSSYNIYIRDKMAELRAGGATGNLMKQAIDAWKVEKGELAEEPTGNVDPSETTDNSDNSDDVHTTDPEDAPAPTKTKKGKKTPKQ
jgi:hypothetical protein